MHYYSKDIYGIRPVERELQNTVVWLNCGFASSLRSLTTNAEIIWEVP